MLFFEMKNISIGYGKSGKALPGTVQRFMHWKPLMTAFWDYTSGKHWKQVAKERS